MNFYDVVDELCEALDARHTGCEIQVLGNKVTVLRTFSYASGRDLLITDVIRALASPDWRKALADAQTALLARIEAYEAKRKLEDDPPGVRLRGRGSL